MKKWSKKIMTGETILVLSLMVVNVINFIFNAFLGRVLSFEEFGLITLLNTFLYIATIAFNALYVTVNHKVAFFTGQNIRRKEEGFLKVILKKTVIISFFISCIWVLAIPFTDKFFHINNYLIPLFFTPVIMLGVSTSIDKGFLQGKFLFHYVAIIIAIEALCKLFLAWIFVSINLHAWTYLAIPLSTLLAFLFATYLTSKKIIGVKSYGSYIFPKKFFSAALLTGIASMAFLTVDVLLAKHFLSPTEAGQFALLSLVGKMVYFFGALPGAFIITSVSNDMGKSLNPIHKFYKLFTATIIFSISAFIGLGLFGNIILPFLLGSKVQAIMQYLMTYAAAITCYAIATSLVIYHLAKHQYFFPKVSVAMAAVMALGIALFHENVGQIAQVILATSVISLAIVGMFHVLEAHFILNQTTEFFKEQYE